MVLQNKIKQPDILFVVNDFNFLKSHRLELLKFLSSKGFKVSVATNLAECSEQDFESKRQANLFFYCKNGVWLSRAVRNGARILWRNIFRVRTFALIVDIYIPISAPDQYLTAF